MKLADVVDAWECVRATRSRTAKRDHLAALLTDRPAEEVALAVTWLSGELVQGRIGVGYALVREVSSVPAAEAPSLAVAEVDAALDAIALLSGKGSGKRRRDDLAHLFGRATAAEQHFLAGLLVGELRQGALEGVMVEGIAAAAGAPADRVRRAVMLSGDLRAAALAAFSGEAALEAFRIEVFRPLQPMLAQTADDVAVALSHLGTAAFEYKLDGARIQVHRQGERVRVYTRALHDVTGAVPEVVELVGALPVERLVLDGEVLAFREDGRPWPFQDTMRRFGRKLDVDALRRTMPLTPFFFDLLLLDDREWLDAPQRERFAALAELLPDSIVPHLVTADAGAAASFLGEALRAGHEGVMAKEPGCPYEAGSRGRSWLKVKPCHTLDLVVLAAEWGSGRRRGWLSNLWLGARDDDGFVMLGKTFKGLTDEMLAWQTGRLLELETSREGHVVHVRPALVVEIAFNEVQASRRYPAGLALRFARVKAFRPDKEPRDADTVDTVREIHEGRRLPG